MLRVKKREFTILNVYRIQMPPKTSAIISDQKTELVGNFLTSKLSHLIVLIQNKYHFERKEKTKVYYYLPDTILIK